LKITFLTVVNDVINSGDFFGLQQATVLFGLMKASKLSAAHRICWHLSAWPVFL